MIRYFERLFCGGWKEARSKAIDITLRDEQGVCEGAEMNARRACTWRARAYDDMALHRLLPLCCSIYPRVKEHPWP